MIGSLLTTALIGASIVLVFVLAERVRGPHAGPTHVLRAALLATAGSVAIWMVLASVLVEPGDGATTGLGVVLMACAAGSVARGRRPAV